MSNTVVEICDEERGDGGRDLAERGFEEAGVEYFYLKKATEKEMFLKSLSEWSENPTDLIAILLKMKSEEAAHFLKEFRDLGEETRKKLLIFWTDGSSTKKSFDIFQQRARETAKEVSFHNFRAIKYDGIYLIQKILNKFEKIAKR